jgi:hypothetical protein
MGAHREAILVCLRGGRGMPCVGMPATSGGDGVKRVGWGGG